MRNAQHVGESVLVAAATLGLLAGCTGGTPSASAPASSAASAAATATPAASAVGDLDRLLERLELTHPEPFHGIPRAEFVTALRDLQARLPALRPEEATVEVMRLVASLSREGRDGHQFALPQPGHEAAVLPVRLYEFDEGVFVTAAMPPYEHLVGAEITAVGAHPISRVLAALEPLVPRDGPATVSTFRPIFLLRTEVLRGLGLVAAGSVELTVRTATGERSAVLEPVPFDEYVGWAGGFGMFQLPARPGTRYLQTGADVLRAETLQAGAGVYLRYTQVQSPGAEATAAATALLTAPGVERLVLDLRQNPGGDNHNNPSLIAMLTEFRARHPAAPIVVLTDRVTFSAAANLATDLERAVDPVYVGEPMGGGLNFWDDVTQLRLDDLPVPMQVGISTRYWERTTPGDPRLTIEPDVRLPVAAADYFADRDPALAVAEDVLVS